MLVRRLVWIVLLLLAGGCVSPHGPGPSQPAQAQPRQCSVIGTWRGMVQGGVLAGRMVDLTFWNNGVARGTSGAIMLEVAWRLEGSRLSITHRDSLPPAAACPVDVVGVYDLQFSDDCSRVTARSIQDLCEHRRRTLDALQARRVQ